MSRDSGDQFLERACVVAQEARALEQVAGRIAGDAELGKDQEIGALRACTDEGFADLVQVSREVSDREIGLG